MSRRLIYSHHATQMLSERGIRPEWVKRTIEEPDAIEPDPIRPGTMKAFRAVTENSNRILRVVYTEAEDTIKIITAFFDRGRAKTK